jgi:hypothetical protein
LGSQGACWHGKDYNFFKTGLFRYGSLQSFNIASIIQAVQVFHSRFIYFNFSNFIIKKNFDTFLISAFGKTCGYGIAPINGIICVTTTCSGSSSPFGSNYMLLTLGGLVRSTSHA